MTLPTQRIRFSSFSERLALFIVEQVNGSAAFNLPRSQLFSWLLFFEQPYCRILNLVERDIAKRQTASSYLFIRDWCSWWRRIVMISKLFKLPVWRVEKSSFFDTFWSYVDAIDIKSVLFDVLNLLPHLFNQYLKFNGALGCFGDDGFGG